MKERNLIVYFKTQTCSSFCKEAFQCSNVIFVTIAVFKLILKHMKNKHGGENPCSLS